MPSSSSSCQKRKYSPEMSRPIIYRPTSDRWIVTSFCSKHKLHSVHLAQSDQINEDEDELPIHIVIKCSAMLQAYQLKNEEKILSRLKSPFVASFFGHETSLRKDEKTPFKWNVMYNTIHEYGRTLENHIKRQDGNMPEDDVRRFASDILLGLKYIHGEKIIHCDINPENILLAHEDNKSISSSSEGLVAKISGFLTAIEKGSVEYGDGMGHRRGTLRYLSPEELRGDMVLDYSADVWAFGCTVFKMLTGEHVWKGYGRFRWERMVRLVGYCDIVPHTPDDLSDKAEDFLSKCLERDPAKRWSVDNLLEHQFLKCTDEDEEEEDEDAEVEAYAENLEFEEAFQEEEAEEAFEEEGEAEEEFEEEQEQEQEEIELDEDYPKEDDL